MTPLAPFPIHPLCPACGSRDCARYTGGVCPAAPNTQVPEEWELVPADQSPKSYNLFDPKQREEWIREGDKK
jgi:hypothetical protein